MVLGPGQGIAQPQDGPSARRRGPVELAVGAQLAGQVDDVSGGDACDRGATRPLQGIVVERDGEAGLELELVDPVIRLQGEL